MDKPYLSYSCDNFFQFEIDEDAAVSVWRGR